MTFFFLKKKKKKEKKKKKGESVELSALEYVEEALMADVQDLPVENQKNMCRDQNL
jgi:hypothetical protein